MGKPYIIKQGECLASIAADFGFRRWQTIYDHADNEELRNTRPNPNIMFPGDTIIIPDKRPRKEKLAVNAKHKITLETSKWRLKLALRDTDGEPVAEEEFTLRGPRLPLIEGKTDSEGVIDIIINPQSSQAVLSIRGNRLDLAIGGLDPASRIEGIQARLNNLGYPAGPVDGVSGRRTRAALRAYQEGRPELTASGELDDDTRRSLLEEHENDDELCPLETDASEGAFSCDPDGEDLYESPRSEPSEDEAAAADDRPWSNDRFCSAEGSSLYFDNCELSWIDEDGSILESWPAISGAEGFQSPEYQNIEDKGPIPEGLWRVAIARYQEIPDHDWIEMVAAELGLTAWPGGESSWGRHRVWLEPADSTTETYQRSGFSIHGGDTPGSSGCIDLTSHIGKFAEKLVDHDSDLLLIVDYSQQRAPTTE